MSSEIRFERVLVLPPPEKRQKSTIYLVADANPHFVEMHMTGKTATSIRRLPTRSDIAPIVDESLDPGDLTLIFDNKLI